jgi:pyruvate/2-oxoglutarate dehydrogenase complex dihydrolipoamide acyltransferase (E2) component
MSSEPQEELEVIVTVETEDAGPDDEPGALNKPPKQESAKTKSPARSPKVAAPPQYKTNIAARVTKAVEDATVDTSTHRSTELVPLTQDFDVMRKNLRNLVLSAKKYHAAAGSVNSARSGVSRVLLKCSHILYIYVHIHCGVLKCFFGICGILFY